jgi:hypothetical protein
MAFLSTSALENDGILFLNIRPKIIFNDFLVYVQRNYFDGNFPPTMWNVFKRNMDNKSNNIVESKFIDQDNICIF